MASEKTRDWLIGKVTRKRWSELPKELRDEIRAVPMAQLAYAVYYQNNWKNPPIGQLAFDVASVLQRHDVELANRFRDAWNASDPAPDFSNWTITIH